MTGADDRAGAVREGRPQRRRRVPPAVRVVVAALVVLAGAELAVRALEPGLPAPPVWADAATATKVRQLEQRSRVGCTDVVFVGSSMTRDGLVPEVFTLADPHDRDAYNAALDAASPALLRRWVTEQVLPHTRPSTVVVGVATVDLNDAAALPDAALEAHESAPGSATGTLAPVERWFIRHVALVRHRGSLRDPSVIVDAVERRLDGRRAPRPSAAGIDGVLAPDGHGLSRRDLRYRGDRTTIDRLARQFLRPFDPGGRQADALARLLGDIRSAGATPVLLRLPVTDDYRQAHPRGLDDVRRAERLLSRVASDTDTPVVEAPELPASAFADTHHLNGDGADALSARLPGLLDGAGVPPERCAAG